MLLRHARCVLSRLRCNGHSLLLSSHLPRIGRIEDPCCSACRHSFQDISHLILHCPDSLCRSLFDDSLAPLVQTLGSCLASGVPWSSAMPPSLERGRVININNNNNIMLKTHLQCIANNVPHPIRRDDPWTRFVLLDSSAGPVPYFFKQKHLS